MKIFTLSLLLSFIAFLSEAQTYNYIPFPDSNTVWRGSGMRGAMGYTWPARYHFQIDRDSLINGKLYHVITAVLYFREDSNKRVYSLGWNNTSSPERLEYDFSLSTGDTMFQGQYSYYVVRGVDTLAYNGMLRRTLHVTPQNSGIYEDWIEGIGSTRATFFANLVGERLCTVFQDSVLIYGNAPENPYCDLSYNSIHEGILDNTLIISPSPADNEIRIQTSSTPASRIALYNLMGAVAKEIEVNGESDIYINTAGLTSGIYIVCALLSNGAIQTHKVLVQH